MRRTDSEQGSPVRRGDLRGYADRRGYCRLVQRCGKPNGFLVAGGEIVSTVSADVGVADRRSFHPCDAEDAQLG